MIIYHIINKPLTSFLVLVLGLVAILAVCRGRNKEKHETSSKLTVYGYMGCPYTVKQINLLKENNVSYKFVSTETPQGANELFTLMKGVRSGVPVTLNNETGKISKGFTSLSEL